VAARARAEQIAPRLISTADLVAAGLRDVSILARWMDGETVWAIASAMGLVPRFVRAVITDGWEGAHTVFPTWHDGHETPRC
jgi:hypothetical protein